ncbi:MAG: double-strand break repair helicase AddA [Pseudomonadota bacterium]
MAGPNKTGAALGSEQSLATDPFADATLSASAGTGKTHVLTSRVFRLLLNGAAPESILCLTFTKAGAAAMAERIGTRLARWVRLSNAELGRELGELGEDIGPATRERARQLFARVLDAPGGIRIQTIHAFAQSLLAAFPAEAGVTPGFKPIEGRAADELVHRTLSDLMANAEASGNEALIGDVQALSRRLGERDAISYLRLCASREEDMTKFDAATIERALRVRMGAPDCDIDAYLADHCSDDKFDCALLHAIADANRGWGGSYGQSHWEAISQWLQLEPAARSRSLDLLRYVVFKKSHEARLVSKGQLKIDPDYQSKSDQLADTISELLSIQSACALAADMAAGLRAGQAFAAAYARAKRAAGVADFNDLIGWARDLLEQDGMGDWVRFKLDRRIDHLLVDEAQDTNADQWAIIGALVEDFYSGASDGEERWRTLLMVGDFKQAIYGFQGTNPREFERMRALFKDKADEFRAAEEAADDGVRQSRDFHDLSMSASFRSAQGVLDAVDAMIAVTGWEAMGLPRAPEPHRSAARNAAFAATVELWAPFALASGNDLAADDDDEEGWIDLRERRYAERIAEQVSQWINYGERLDSTGAAIKPGDILILVRSRKELASLIVARLFEAGVPVAGIDRLHLHEPLAVQDLLAAMSFAVQPLDDLNLANLLVSPLLGWSQEELLDLAASRKGRLWPALRDRAPGNPRAAEARDVLLQLLNMADYTTPARFLETILSGPIGGRRKLTKRLSMAARDPIDELMSSALQFERDDIPSLERFLAWFRRGDVEIARDASAPANEVRVMTVHGAKGLEAPVVIIADAHADPAKLGQLGPIEADLDGARVPVVRPRKDELVEPFAGIIADHQLASLEEHWRLLYVGLTRAIDRLVVAGLLPANGKLPLASWHSKMGEALERLGASEERHSLWGSVQRYSSVGKSPAKASGKPAAAAALPAVEIPSWAKRPAPKEERPPRPLAPSAIAKDDVAAPPPSIAQREAAQRGIWIHALLERLVEVVPEQRHAAAQRWLEQSAGVGDGAQRSEIADQVCGILSDPRYSSLFGVGSLGEAPLAATLADGQVIAGTVDRLLVETDRISVIDFKTGRVPRDAGDIPSAHRAQMAAYAAALALIFPGRAVRSALLYTSGPRLFELEA